MADVCVTSLMQDPSTFVGCYPRSIARKRIHSEEWRRRRRSIVRPPGKSHSVSYYAHRLMKPVYVWVTLISQDYIHGSGSAISQGKRTSGAGVLSGCLMLMGL